MPPTKGCSDCCIIEAAPGIVTSGVRLATLSPETVVAPMAVLHGEVASLRFDRLSSWLFLDAGPPTGTGVALHLLHGILLN